MDEFRDGEFLDNIHKVIRSRFTNSTSIEEIFLQISSSNSEVNASELLENLELMFSLYYMHSDI